MRKWLFLLIAALLFNVIQAQAETVFYTNKKDRYYHADENCDRPDKLWEWYASAQPYEREIYQKYEISAEAAAEFQKKPCPVCVKDFKPVYLGDHLPDQWQLDDSIQPWEFEPDFLQMSMTDEDFHWEVVDTHRAFAEYYEEYAEYKTGIIKRKHDYPSCYAGIYTNVQGSYSYLIVDPTEEILAAFERMFGSGAWIIPAKYGYNEMDAVVLDMMDAVREWCDAHPDVDAGASSGSVDEIHNCVTIGIWGEDWRQAAAAMEEVAPIFVRFVQVGKLELDAS